MRVVLIVALRELDERLGRSPRRRRAFDDRRKRSLGSEASETAIPELSFPVYPVIPSGSESGDDLRITGTTIRQTNFEVSPVTVTARYALSGSMRGEAVAVLTDVQTQVVIEEKKIDLGSSDSTGSVTFQFRPQDVGLRFYRINLFRSADRAAFDNLSTLIESKSSETTLVNNTELVAVDRGQGPYRVLYVSGRPNWEFKFLKRAIAEDSEIRLRGLIRMANKQPKFSFPRS